MIPETQQTQLRAILSLRYSVSRTATHRRREQNLARLEAELEELTLKGCRRIPRAYAVRLQELLVDVPPQKADLIRPTMAIDHAIALIFEHLMEQPTLQTPEPRSQDCRWCGGPKPFQGPFCSDDHARRALALDEELDQLRREGASTNALRQRRFRDRTQGVAPRGRVSRWSTLARGS